MTALLELLKGVLGAKFGNLSAGQLLTLGARLLPVIPDLMDGDPKLSPENRLKIEDAIAQFEAEVLK